MSSYCTNFADYLDGYGFGILKGALRSHLLRFHSAARMTFCPSEATRRDLLELGFHTRLRLWNRGVDTDLFHPSRRSDRVRERMACAADVVLAYVGRIAPEKKVDLLFEALPKIRDGTRRSISLALVGGGPSVTRLRELEMEGVHFAGYRRGEELAAHYASADIFVFPSDTETFGQVVTEAMASGLPVVAPARGGVLDTVVPGETGYLFAPGDADAMADAVLRLVNHDDVRTRMGCRARAHAESRRWPDVFRKLFADYSDAADRRDGAVT